MVERERLVGRVAQRDVGEHDPGGRCHRPGCGGRRRAAGSSKCIAVATSRREGDFPATSKRRRAAAAEADRYWLATGSGRTAFEARQRSGAPARQARRRSVGPRGRAAWPAARTAATANHVRNVPPALAPAEMRRHRAAAAALTASSLVCATRANLPASARETPADQGGPAPGRRATGSAGPAPRSALARAGGPAAASAATARFLPTAWSASTGKTSVG